jgi:uncharacterized Ntn-hydrolase superfamily protein
MGIKNFMTFSIIAYDQKENKIGASICSAIPFIGKYGLFIFPNVCAVTAQGKLDPSTAFVIRDLILQNKENNEINEYLKTYDSAYNRKQTSFINLKDFNKFSYTGIDLQNKNTDMGTSFADSIIGDNYIISGNFLESLSTLKIMEQKFLSSSDKPLEDRLMLTLEAGHNTIGDLRGRQSAAIQIFKEENEYPMISIDVDDHMNPVEELRRIFDYSQKNWQYIPNTCFVGKDFDYEKIWKDVDWDDIMPKILQFERHRSKRTE